MKRRLVVVVCIVVGVILFLMRRGPEDVCSALRQDRDEASAVFATYARSDAGFWPAAEANARAYHRLVEAGCTP